MKNHVPGGGRSLRFATARQRAFTGLLVLVFVALVLAARSGRYDREVNALADWLETSYDHVVAFTQRTFRRH